MQPWRTPFWIWNQSVVPCPVLTVASWLAYRFLRRQVTWSGIPISWRIFHSLLWYTHSKALAKSSRGNVFLELCCFFYEPTDVGNLIFGSSAFSKPRLYIWKFSVHILLKLSLKDFECYLASMWNERNCMVFWNSLALPFARIGVKTDLFQSCPHRNLKNNRMISVHFQGKPFNIMVI